MVQYTLYTLCTPVDRIFNVCQAKRELTKKENIYPENRYISLSAEGSDAANTKAT